MSTDPRVDAYIEGRAEFARPILAWLRTRFHAALPEVEEAIKWSHPFFTLQGKPFANMAAFKAHVSFGFWNRQDNQTGKEGEAMGQFGRIESLADLPGEAEIEQMIREAAAKLAEDKPPGPGRRPRVRRKYRPISLKRWPPTMPPPPPSTASRRAAAANIANGSPTRSARRPGPSAWPMRWRGCAKASAATGNTRIASLPLPARGERVGERGMTAARSRIDPHAPPSAALSPNGEGENMPCHPSST
jgi:hypothetical protein